MAPRVHHRPTCQLCGVQDAVTQDKLGADAIRVCLGCKEWKPPRPKSVDHRDRVLRVLGRLDEQPDLAEICEVLDENTVEGRARVAQVLTRAVRAGLVGFVGRWNRTYYLVRKP